MIELTIRVSNLETGRRLAALLRDAAAEEPHRGQARHYRASASRLERLTRPFRYTPRVQRPASQEIDELAIRRVVRGEHPLPVLSRTEARIASLHLWRRGVSAAETARRIRVAQRTVVRWRAEDRQAAA